MTGSSAGGSPKACRYDAAVSHSLLFLYAIGNGACGMRGGGKREARQAGIINSGAKDKHLKRMLIF